VRALEDGLNMYMEKTGLQLSEVKRVRTGYKRLSSKTAKSYKKHYDGLYRFAAMIGAYDTCFVLSHYAPNDFCPSMDADVVALYMMYKTQSTTLKLTRQGQDVLNIFNEPVFCTGSWKDPGNCVQFLTAISRIHSSLNQREAYLETCEACIESYKENSLSTGCHCHPGQFRFWRRGNPRFSERVQNAFHAAKDICSAHVVKGSYQLLPKEVRAIRTNLLSTGKQDDLQLFCIVLLSIYMFLRHDECHHMKVDDILPQFSSVEKHRVINLCIRIQGKTDKIPQNMILWSYDDCPALCPVRHLLTYVHLCDIKEGYLFPNLKKKSEPRSYDSVMNILNRRFTNILNRDAKLTTHTFRKTGYLFALWGGADLQTARASARHKADIMAQRYADCSRFLLEAASARDPNAKYQVGRFKMAISVQAAAVRSVNEETILFESLHDLSQLFLLQIGLGPTHVGRKTLMTVVDLAVKFNPGVGTEAELESVLSCLSDDRRTRMKGILEKVRQSSSNENSKLMAEIKKLLAIIDNLRDEITQMKSNAPSLPKAASLSNEPTLSDEPMPSDEPTPSDQPPNLKNKKRRGGSENLDEERKFLKKARGMPRLEYIVSLREQYPDTGNLTESGRNFMNRAVIPIMNCLEMHHNNVKKQFLQKWPLTRGGITTFLWTKCNCKGPVCGIS
jgi:hypothetical protein